MKKLLSSGLLLCLAATIAACSVVGQPVAEKAADAIDEYCTREPYSARQVYRNTINAELEGAGHQVSVRCAGDPED